MEVEIWSDIACPWCYVGRRRLERALAQFEHSDEVSLIWRSFELDPRAPREHEGERAARIAQKYGISVGRAREAERHLAEVAETDGLTVRFDIARSGSTFDAHRVVHLAAAKGLQDAMKQRLMRAYFAEGELVSDHETLMRLALEVGLQEQDVRETLAGERYAAEVRGDEQTALDVGISSVPTFVIDRTLGVSGAHPPEVLLDLLREGWARRAAPAEGRAHEHTEGTRQSAPAEDAGAIIGDPGALVRDAGA